MSAARRPWLAALLSLLGTPGLGQLYNGRGWKALAFALGPSVAAVVLIVPTLRGPTRPLHFLGLLLLLLAAWVLGGVDAFLDARRWADVPRRWYSRWWALAGAYLVAAMTMPTLTAALVLTSMSTFRNVGRSMEPTILSGDYVIADKTAYGIRPSARDKPIGGLRVPGRRDLAVFLSPRDRRLAFIKRVIGLPGETVEIRGRMVCVNGQLLDEPYAHFISDEDDDTLEDWGPETVPAGQVFVLGDVRDNSIDSRHFGFVPLADFRSKVKLVYFSVDERNGRRIRWERIGLTPR